MEHRATIALGSNIAPEHNIEQALAHLARQVRLLGVSCFYRTAPIGDDAAPAFLNGAALIATELSARDLKFGVLRPVETALGRRREANKFAARTIDLDILLYGDESIDEPALQVPDPDLKTRAFLAAALLDLLPDATLPDGTRVDALHAPESLKSLEIHTEFTSRMKERFTP